MCGRPFQKPGYIHEDFGIQIVKLVLKYLLNNMIHYHMYLQPPWLFMECTFFHSLVV